MPFKPKALVVAGFQAILCAGALALDPSQGDPAAFKIPIMLLGILGLLPLLVFRLRAGTHLLPGLLLFLYLYVRVADTPERSAAALTLLASAAAFLFGIARVPMAGIRILIPFFLACVGRGVLDLLTLDHLGGIAPPGHAVTSFFLDKHVAGGVLVLGAFLHFHLMERGGPQKPVQVLLYTSSLLVMLAIVLSDSRIVQGAFLVCFLPLLFLSIRLDGREPAMERLAWIGGITLCLGLAWINLPELHHRRVAEAFSPSEPGIVRVSWTAALRTADEAPLAGAGLGAFRYAASDKTGGWIDPARPEELPILLHAQNHFLHVFAEGGGIALALEAFLLLIALLGMAVMYFREWTLQAKYAFFSLAALSLMGLFTSILDRAPLNVAYWGLIGYGWSFAVRAMPAWMRPHRGKSADPRRRDRIAGAVTAALLGCLISWHLFQRAKEIQSTRLFKKAQALSDSNPRRSTDILAQALAWNPRNEEANYGYARVLAFFHREKDAVDRVAYVQGFAPDWRRRAEVLSEVYRVMGRPDKAAEQAAVLLGTYPHHLASLELKADALKAAHACAALDTFRLAAARLATVYRMPASRDYTIQSLDSLFKTNRDINFLQRWFAGPALRRSFVDRRMLAYNRSFQYYSRALFLRDARCPAPEEGDPRRAPAYGYPYQVPAGITPEGEPEPTSWPKPKPKPTPKKKKKNKYKHRNLALGDQGLDGTLPAAMG